MKIETGSGFFLIFLVLFVLKLCSVITISWWIVTLPLWGGFAIILIISGLILLGCLIHDLVKK